MNKDIVHDIKTFTEYNRDNLSNTSLNLNSHTHAFNYWSTDSYRIRSFFNHQNDDDIHVFKVDACFSQLDF